MNEEKKTVACRRKDQEAENRLAVSNYCLIEALKALWARMWACVIGINKHAN